MHFGGSGSRRRFCWTLRWSGTAAVDQLLLARFHPVETVIEYACRFLPTDPASYLIQLTRVVGISRIRQESEAINIIAAILLAVFETRSAGAQVSVRSVLWVNGLGIIVGPRIG